MRWTDDCFWPNLAAGVEHGYDCYRGLGVMCSLPAMCTSLPLSRPKAGQLRPKLPFEKMLSVFFGKVETQCVTTKRKVASQQK